MYRYAQLDENNTVTAISELSGHVDLPYMILINDRHDIGFGWRYIDYEWLAPLPTENTPPVLTNEDIIMLALADIYKRIEEVM